MSSYLQRNRIRSFAISIASRFLALAIISSFAVTTLPLVTSAEEPTMPCCVGKAEGHCDSGLTAPKAPQPEPEPMCGWTSPDVLNLDEVTVAAEPVHHHSHTSSAESSSTSPAAESNTVERQCQMDCGACATATSRHKREKSVVQAKSTHAPATTATARVENRAPIFSSNKQWTRISPRGPPSRA
jgi:hypothetical protein